MTEHLLRKTLTKIFAEYAHNHSFRLLYAFFLRGLRLLRMALLDVWSCIKMFAKYAMHHLYSLLFLSIQRITTDLHRSLDCSIRGMETFTRPEVGIAPLEGWKLRFVGLSLA